MKNVTKDPMFRFLAVLAIASMTGLRGWQTLFNNFAVEIVNLEGNHIGIIQSIREVPGFLALLAIFIFLVMKEHRLSALSITILGLGLALTGFFPSFVGLIFTTLIMSLGFHYYETTLQSLTLQYFSIDITPWVFGKFRSYTAAASIVVGLSIWLISFSLSYKMIFLIIGGLIVCMGLWGMLQNPSRKDIVPQHKKMIFRKKYWLFYLLTFLSGGRRQIFVAFSVFLMVSKFGYSVQELTLLFVFNNIITYFLSPLIGKAIIRFGERKVLSLEYFSLIIVFLAYAGVESKILIAGLYILDHIFFNFVIGVRTFFQKVGEPADLAPSMAVGVTVNHISSVIIPVIGGFLWIIDYRIPFVAAAAMSLVSLIAAQFIDTSIRKARRYLI